MNQEPSEEASQIIDKVGPMFLLLCLPSIVSYTEYEQDVDKNSQGSSDHDQDDFNTEICPDKNYFWSYFAVCSLVSHTVEVLVGQTVLSVKCSQLRNLHNEVRKQP